MGEGAKNVKTLIWKKKGEYHPTHQIVDLLLTYINAFRRALIRVVALSLEFKKLLYSGS